MKRLSSRARHATTVIALAACLLGFAAPACLAQSEEDLARVVHSSACPDDLTPYDPMTYKEHCAGMDESCATSDAGCFEDARRCWDEVNRMNRQIYTYDSFVHQCSARAEAAAPAKLPTKLPTRRPAAAPTKKKPAVP